MKLNAARVHAKLGNIDEAIEILGDFENSPDADVNKTIARVFNLNFSTVARRNFRLECENPPSRPNIVQCRLP